MFYRNDGGLRSFGLDPRGLPMTPVSAKVLAVEKTGDRYRVIVQIETKYRGSFNTFVFGENKPLIGAYHNGRLDLVYHRDPCLEAGQVFPVWTIQQFQSRTRRYRPSRHGLG